MPVPVSPSPAVPRTDTADLHYKPQYLDGFPTPQVGDSSMGVIDTMAVMEVPAAGQARPFASSPLHDTPSMVLLLLGLLAMAMSYHTGYKYIENFFHNMFSTRRRENMFEDHTVNETGILAALLANTFIVEGFITYFAVQLFRPDLASSLQSSVFLHIAAFCAIAAGFYVIQWLVYKLLGYTFSDKVGSKLWIDGFNASQSFLGLLLLLVLVPLMLFPASGKMLLTVAALVYVVARLIFIYKGFRIFYSNMTSCIYFLLYLCAVEIVPLALVAGVTVWVCGILSI